MKRTAGQRIKWGEGRILLVALTLILLSAVLVYALKRPEPQTFLPRHAALPLRAEASPVNINTASAAQLEALPGIGKVLAERIVRERTENGPFADIEELARVDGVGPAKLEAVREWICVESAE